MPHHQLKLVQVEQAQILILLSHHLLAQAYLVITQVVVAVVFMAVVQRLEQAAQVAAVQVI
jgi:hypothetical protein